MNQELVATLNRYQYMADNILKTSEEVIESLIIGNTEKATQDIDNRDRMISVIGFIQEKLEKIVKSNSLSQVEIGKIKSAHHLVNISLDIVAEKDKTILDLLGRIKEDMVKDITSTYKSKNQVQSYNLKNVNR